MVSLMPRVCQGCQQMSGGNRTWECELGSDSLWTRSTASRETSWTDGPSRPGPTRSHQSRDPLVVTSIEVHTGANGACRARLHPSDAVGADRFV